MDLHEAEGWWTYWQTNGTRDADGPGVNDEREAATVLQAEYDRLRKVEAAARAYVAAEYGDVELGEKVWNDLVAVAGPSS